MEVLLGHPDLRRLSLHTPLYPIGGGNHEYPPDVADR